MKKVVVLWSSPNQDGLTASAKNQFVNGLREAGENLRGQAGNRFCYVLLTGMSKGCPGKKAHKKSGSPPPGLVY